MSRRRRHARKPGVVYNIQGGLDVFSDNEIKEIPTVLHVDHGNHPILGWFLQLGANWLIHARTELVFQDPGTGWIPPSCTGGPLLGTI